MSLFMCCPFPSRWIAVEITSLHITLGERGGKRKINKFHYLCRTQLREREVPNGHVDSVISSLLTQQQCGYNRITNTTPHQRNMSQDLLGERNVEVLLPLCRCADLLAPVLIKQHRIQTNTCIYILTFRSLSFSSDFISR